MRSVAIPTAVTPGLVPGGHVFRKQSGKTWMAGSSPAMTKQNWCAYADARRI